jgi:flagellar biosynthesis protein FlhG
MENHALNTHSLASGCRPAATVLAVTSGKGGVGKTNIAANLALCLAGMNQRVLLLDADLSLGNLDLVMGLRHRYNLSHVLSGHKRMEEVIQSGPRGLRVICGASGLDRLADISKGEQYRILEPLCRLQQETDAIVIDTAAGISSAVMGFCLAADRVLVVTTPEATAMADAYAAIKVLVRKQYHGPINLVVNMARHPAEGRQVYQRIADVARKFLRANVYYAGTLLHDERLCAAVRSRRPVVLAYPRSPISLSLAALACRLSGTRPGDPPEGGFFRRVIRWLS